MFSVVNRIGAVAVFSVFFSVVNRIGAVAVVSVVN